MSNRAALMVASVLAVSACAPPPPTAPSNINVFPPIVDPNSGSVSGRVLVHSGEGIEVAAGAKVFGWQEFVNGGGATTGAITTDADGHYRIFPSSETLRVRIAGMGGGLYQPCAVTANTASLSSSYDVHLVSDLSLLGANLPDVFMSQGSLLSGIVYELTDSGRQPLANAAIDLDGMNGDGVLIATTRTDAGGRFVLCNVPFGPSLYLFASKEGFQLSGRGQLDASSPVEFELRSK